MLENPSSQQGAREAAARTLDWARRSQNYFQQHGDSAKQMLVGIVQGGTSPEVRRENADALVELKFPGYAIGGLAVGESHGLTCEIAQVAVSRLPTDRPRYLMGVGYPQQLPDYVALGVDMMDCVLP